MHPPSFPAFFTPVTQEGGQRLLRALSLEDGSLLLPLEEERGPAEAPTLGSGLV